MTDAVTAKLAEWEALVEGATEGEWSWIHDTRVSGERVCRIGSLSGNCDVGWTPRGNGEADAEFIAAAREMVPALLGFVREVRAEASDNISPDYRGDAYDQGWQEGRDAMTAEIERAARKWLGGEE